MFNLNWCILQVNLFFWSLQTSMTLEIIRDQNVINREIFKPFCHLYWFLPLNACFMKIKWCFFSGSWGAPLFRIKLVASISTLYTHFTQWGMIKHTFQNTILNQLMLKIGYFYMINWVDNKNKPCKEFKSWYQCDWWRTHSHFDKGLMLETSAFELFMMLKIDWPRIATDWGQSLVIYWVPPRRLTCCN